MDFSDARRLKTHEEENVKLPAEQLLGNAILKDLRFTSTRLKGRVEKLAIGA